MTLHAGKLESRGQSQGKILRIVVYLCLEVGVVHALEVCEVCLFVFETYSFNDKGSRIESQMSESVVQYLIALVFAGGLGRQTRTKTEQKENSDDARGYKSFYNTSVVEDFLHKSFLVVLSVQR